MSSKVKIEDRNSLMRIIESMLVADGSSSQEIVEVVLDLAGLPDQSIQETMDAINTGKEKLQLGFTIGGKKVIIVVEV